MADDSLEILEEHAFHPADPPQGMRNYDLGSLKPSQQRTLNKLKMIQRIENENYLKAHPEIRGLISILLRYILSRKPFSNVHEVVGSFFTQPVEKITAELTEYLMDNCYSTPVVDVLDKEITTLQENGWSENESDIVRQKSSFSSSETSLDSVTSSQI